MEAGNVIQRTLGGGKTQTLKWDAEGRLISVSQRDGINNGYDWSAIYDGLGRREAKTINGSLTEFLYDVEETGSDFDIHTFF
jgi:YD repeat-containing protein